MYLISLKKSLACNPTFYYKQDWLGFQYQNLTEDDIDFIKSNKSVYLKEKLNPDRYGRVFCPKVPGAYFDDPLVKRNIKLTDGVSDDFLDTYF